MRADLTEYNLASVSTKKPCRIDRAFSMYGKSDVEQEIQHITIFHHIFLAYSAHFAGFFGALLTFIGNEIIKGDGLGADEAFFEVGVNHTSGLG